MISFGELRKKSVAWQMELGAVEKIYALYEFLRGVAERPALRATLTLRGASALALAYFENYPRVEDVEFAHTAFAHDDALAQEINAAVADTARLSGLQFKLHDFQPTQARIEFTGPLGRRSAAQPFLVARFISSAPRLEPQTRALLYPFGEACAAELRVVALEELAAERMVLFAQKPRARDVFDLWFILKYGAAALDAAQTRNLAQRVAEEKRLVLRNRLDENYAPLLARAWENALRDFRAHPPFSQTCAEIESLWDEIL